MLNQFVISIYKDALESDYSAEAFASDAALSNVWEGGSGEEVPQKVIMQRYELCKRLYLLAHDNISILPKSLEMTNTQFAKAFCIPQATFEAWSAGTREPAVYLKLLLAESCGYIK